MNGVESSFKEMMENFPILGKEIDIQIQEARRVAKNMNPKKPTTRHIKIKVSKVKDKRILKAVKENQLVTHKAATR